jgi:hypothetical protein
MSTRRLLDLLFGLMGGVGLGWDGNRDKKKKKRDAYELLGGCGGISSTPPFPRGINSRRISINT